MTLFYWLQKKKISDFRMFNHKKMLENTLKIKKSAKNQKFFFFFVNFFVVFLIFNVQCTFKHFNKKLIKHSKARV